MDVGLLWGKTLTPAGYHPLVAHLLDVAAVAEALGRRFPWAVAMPAAQVALVAALHDLGKADPYFQNKAPEQADRLRTAGVALPTLLEPYRHEARSADWMLAHLIDTCGWSPKAARVVATVVRGHHGNFASQLGIPGDDRERDPAVARWEAARDALAHRVWATLTPAPWRAEPFAHAGVAGVRLAGLLVLADWIASNEAVYRYPLLPRDVADADYLAEARREAARAVDALGFAPVSADDTPVTFIGLLPACATPRPTQSALQAVLADDPPAPGLAIIEAPMGEGKTEAAIFLAEQWRRVAGCTGTYLALPTGATSNQMHKRYADFLTRIRPGVAPRLVHGMAWLIDDSTPDTTAPLGAAEDADALALRQGWFRPSKRALLAPEAVGTIDQALMAALQVKFGVLRLFGLADKVLIIDEVHAYDTYMTTILCRLLAWCRALEIPVILLSATLAAAQRDTLVAAYTGTPAPTIPDAGEHAAYPLLTFVTPAGEHRTVPVATDTAARREVAVRLHTGLLTQPAAIAALAAAETADGGCACVIMNTVAEAQAVFAALQDLALPVGTLLLFHARFRAEARNAREQQVTSCFGKTGTRPQRAILVATQVVEQSLDVDFDVMISALAPIDLLLQRSGRLWRHERAERPVAQPVLHILLPADSDFGGTGKVYQHAPLWHTLALLRTHTTIVLPQDFRPLIEGCYGPTPATDGIDPAVLAEAYRALDEARAEEERLAREHLIPAPSVKTFDLHSRPPVDEDEDGTATGYLHASTRLGSTTRPALVLHDPALIALTLSETPPARDRLKQLFLQKVDLPAWWFAGVVDMAGQPVAPLTPSWLRGHLVLPMRDGIWRGTDATGRTVIIADDAARGLLRMVEEEALDDF